MRCSATRGRSGGLRCVGGLLQWHGRLATAAELADLDVVPARAVTYRRAGVQEPDVAAVLDRRPELVLVDELAHANVPSERHAKR